MRNMRPRVERLERLMSEHLKRNPPEFDLDELSKEERQALIELGTMMEEYIKTIPKEEIAKVGAEILEMIQESRRS